MLSVAILLLKKCNLQIIHLAGCQLACDGDGMLHKLCSENAKEFWSKKSHLESLCLVEENLQ